MKGQHYTERNVEGKKKEITNEIPNLYFLVSSVLYWGSDKKYKIPTSTTIRGRLLTDDLNYAQLRWLLSPSIVPFVTQRERSVRGGPNGNEPTQMWLI